MKQILQGVFKHGNHMFIGNDVYYRNPTDKQRLKANDLGNGHIELIAQRVYEYEQLEMDDHAKRSLIQMFTEPLEEPTAQEIADREALSLKMSARRAKTRVRRLCKVMGADTLLTFTYRANVTDLALCKRHLKEFVRRLYRTIPDFRGVAAFEQQERGAWHVHMAVDRMPASLKIDGVKVKSFDLLRRVWRSVTQEHGGTVNVKHDKRSGGALRSAARIASYISKYITKAFEEGAKWSNRWTKFGDVEVPKAVDLGTYNNMLDAVRAAYDLITDSAKVVDQTASKWGDFFFLVVENNGLKPPA